MDDFPGKTGIGNGEMVFIVVLAIAGIVFVIWYGGSSTAQGRQLTVAERQPPVVELDVGARAVPAKDPLVLKASTVWLPVERTAVDLAFVVERDADDKVMKIHRFILWNNGDVTSPDLPKVPNPCPADINGDGKVGIPDMLILQAAWGTDCP